MMLNIETLQRILIDDVRANKACEENMGNLSNSDNMTSVSACELRFTFQGHTETCTHSLSL